MITVLFLDFLNNVVRVLGFSEEVVRAGFNFGAVREFSVKKELGMLFENAVLIGVQASEEGLRPVFGGGFVAFPECAGMVFNVSRHFKLNVNFT